MGDVKYYIIHTYKPQFIAQYIVGKSNPNESQHTTQMLFKGKTIFIHILEFFGEPGELKNIEGLLKVTCDKLKNYLLNN